MLGCTSAGQLKPEVAEVAVSALEKVNLACSMALALFPSLEPVASLCGGYRDIHDRLLPDQQVRQADVVCDRIGEYVTLAEQPKGTDVKALVANQDAMSYTALQLLECASKGTDCTARLQSAQ